MLEIIHESVIDSLYLIPWLFLTFLFIEFLEKKASMKTRKMIEDSGNAGPLLGGTLGSIPGCGFSVVAANLYTTRVITIGTLISVFLATSDEMLPLLIAYGVGFNFILRILIIKIIISVIAGLIIDRLIKSNKINIMNTSILDAKRKCQCEKSNIFKNAILHTLKIFGFIIIIAIILNLIIAGIGKDTLAGLLKQNTVIGVFIAALVGLIPSCAGSVLITSLYIADTITFGTLMAGLLSGAGIGLAVLFKVNKNIKDNLKIVLILLLVGILSGIIIDLIGI